MREADSFCEFRRNFPAFPPRIRPRNSGGIVLMTVADGLCDVTTPTPQAHTVSNAPTTAQDAPVHRFLWAIAQASVPYALEDCNFGRALETGVIKHTNLTGGEAAHCGGELWFLGDNKIVINGSSGRYGPLTSVQLREAGLAFKACGYQVASMGYDDELNAAPDIVAGEGDLEWL